VIVPTHEILDRPHARSHIHDCANALFVGSSDQSKLWAKKWNLHLKENGPAVFEEELQRLAKMEWSEEGKRKLTNLIEYVREHLSRRRCSETPRRCSLRCRYPDFKKRGFPVASGAIESANRQVVGDRCKRSGMRWTQVWTRVSFQIASWGSVQKIRDEVDTRRTSATLEPEGGPPEWQLGGHLQGHPLPALDRHPPIDRGIGIPSDPNGTAPFPWIFDARIPGSSTPESLDLH